MYYLNLSIIDSSPVNFTEPKEEKKDVNQQLLKGSYVF